MPPKQGEVAKEAEPGAATPTVEENRPPAPGEVGEGGEPAAATPTAATSTNMPPARGEDVEDGAAWAGEGEAVVETTAEGAESEDTEPKEEKEPVTGAADDAAADADGTKKITALEGGKVVRIDGEKLVFNEVLLIYEDEGERRFVDVKRGRGGERPAAVDNGASSSKVRIFATQSAFVHIAAQMCVAPPPLFTHVFGAAPFVHTCVRPLTFVHNVYDPQFAAAKTEAKLQKKSKNRASRKYIPSVTSFAILAVEEATTEAKTETTAVVEETALVANNNNKKKNGSVAAPRFVEVDAPKNGEKKNGVISLFLAATMVCAGVGAAGVGGDWAIGIPAVEKDPTETWAWSAFWVEREEEHESLAGAVRVLDENEEQAVEPIE